MSTHSKAAGVKACTFVFGERAEEVITSSGFFIQPGHLLFLREVGFLFNPEWCMLCLQVCREHAQQEERCSHRLLWRLCARVVCGQAEAQQKGREEDNGS